MMLLISLSVAVTLQHRSPAKTRVARKDHFSLHKMLGLEAEILAIIFVRIPHPTNEKGTQRKVHPERA